MKKHLFIIICILIFSCADDKKNRSVPETRNVSGGENPKERSQPSSDDMERPLKSLDGPNNKKGGDTSGENTPPHLTALKELFKNGQGDSSQGEAPDPFGDMFKSDAILDLLQANGISREAMDKLIDNPDSLKMLAKEAIRNRKESQLGKPRAKGGLSEAELRSKNTPTGVSLQEAILLVQEESGPEATIAKLKKIDALAGTDVMGKMDLKEAQYVLNDVERKNEPEASVEEVAEIEKTRLLSGQLHSEKEAKELLAKLEKKEKDIKSGALKASPRYQRAIEHQKNTVAIFYGSIKRKAKAAKKKFQQRNPDLYFGEEVGETYIGHMRKPVYLPLGKLSFSDAVVDAHHPMLKTRDTAFVLGEPDGIVRFEVHNDTGIYSLGLGGQLTVRFTDNALTDVNGPDLYIFEIGQIEPTDLEISKNGKEWVYVGKIDGGVAEVDIAPYVNKGELFYFVRLKDLKTKSGEPGADVDAIAAIGAAMRLNLDSKVLFETGRSALRPKGITALKELAASIAVLKKGNVIVEGHTDDVGSKDANQRLSLARAKSVSTELKKILPSGFKWKERGLGESVPLAKNDSDENRAKNRRVEILVIPH